MRRNIVKFTVVAIVMTCGLIGSWSCQLPGAYAASATSNEAQAYLEKGIGYSNNGQLDQAIAAYTKALQINPQFADAYYGRGWVYAKQAQVVQALADFTRVLQINPQYANAWLLRGAACEDLHNKAGALEAYRQFLRYASAETETDSHWIKYTKEKIAALGG